MKTARRALFGAALVLACACAKRSNDSGEPTASATPTATSTIPHIKLSDQPKLRGGEPGTKVRVPDAEAMATGRKLHPTVAKQCKDTACRHEKCGPLCTQWLREKQADGAPPTLGHQKKFFDCLAYCMDENPSLPAR